MAEIKREDVDAVASKLQSFANTLPEQEKNVLSWLLSRAQASTEISEMSDEALDAVSGGQAMSSQLAESLGFGEYNEAVEVSGTIKWSK
jgi:hypothetical protein